MSLISTDSTSEYICISGQLTCRPSRCCLRTLDSHPTAQSTMILASGPVENAWEAAEMMCVPATVSRPPHLFCDGRHDTTSLRHATATNLVNAIRETLDASMRVPVDCRFQRKPPRPNLVRGGFRLGLLRRRCLPDGHPLKRLPVGRISAPSITKNIYNGPRRFERHSFDFT